MREALSGLRLTLTLTAHPTQSNRRTVLERLYRIHRHLQERDRCALTPLELVRNRAHVREDLTALWQTDELRRERPTVGDEVKTALFYAEGVLLGMLPSFTEDLAAAFERVFGEPLGSLPEPLRLHSWAGGDMDGNPRVTPEVLADTLSAHRIRGLERLLSQIKALGDDLSQSDRRVPVLPELLALNEREAALLPDVHAEHRARTQGEPFRRALRFVQVRLEATLAGARLRRRQPEAPNPPHAYPDPSPLVATLEILVRALEHAGAQHAGLRPARELLERVRSAGFYLLELEVRAPAEDAHAALAAVEAGRAPEEGAARLHGRAGRGRPGTARGWRGRLPHADPLHGREPGGRPRGAEARAGHRTLHGAGGLGGRGPAAGDAVRPWSAARSWCARSSPIRSTGGTWRPAESRR